MHERHHDDTTRQVTHLMVQTLTMERKEETSGISAFKRVQSRYKRQANAPDRLDDVDELVDFSRRLLDDRVENVTLPDYNSINNYHGPLYSLNGFPGFLVAPQALSESLQTELSFAAVSTYCEPPHATNIDSVPPKQSEDNNRDESMWSLWKQENCFDDESHLSDANRSKKKYRSFRKLSWATMGYHYDWTQRCYHEGAKSPMPTILQQLSQLFATTALWLEGSKSTSYTASACIVNYYSQKSLMGGHTDELELALDKPIVSISTGRPAIFLLGGKTKDETPIVPILVRPGDVMVMGGDSRLRYHGMARLLPNTLPKMETDRIPTANQQISAASLGLTYTKDLSKVDEQALQAFLSQHRININVRQVYPDE